jgi:hypothetical protein
VLTTYRDSSGRFATERSATFKHEEGQHFVRVFGRWAKLTPITPEVFFARLKRVSDAQQRAMSAFSPHRQARGDTVQQANLDDMRRQLEPFITKGRDVMKAARADGIDFTEAKQELDAVLSFYGMAPKQD